MHLSRLVTAALAALLAFASPAAGTAVQEPAQAPGQRPIVEELVIKGAGDREEAVRMAMRTEEGKPLNLSVVDRDAGFLWQRMKVRLLRTDFVELSPGRVRLIVYVDAVPALQRVVFEGNEEFEREELLLQAGLTYAQAITRETVGQVVRELEAYYKSEGFHFVKITPSFEEQLNQVRLVIEEGPKVRVGDVEFVGNEAFPGSSFMGIGLNLSGEIEAGDGFLIFPGSVFSEDLLQRDKTALELLYQDYGYLDAKVSIESLEFYSDNSRVAVTFRVDEGQPYVVRSVQIVSDDENTPLRFPVERLEELIGLQAGQPVERARIAADEAALRTFYGRRGHPAVATTQRQVSESFWSFNPPDGKPELAFELGSHDVDVIYRIHEGSTMRLRDVVIRGNAQTKDPVIRRHVSLEPGDLADSEEALRSYRRLVGLNYFTDSQTRAPFVLWRFLETDRDDWVDLEYTVQEGQTGRLLFGGGFNTNSGPFVSLNIQKDNFDLFDTPSSFGNALDEILGSQAFTGGGQTLRLFLAPGTEFSQYQISFFEPDLFGDHIDRVTFGPRFFKTFFLLDTHDERRTGGAFTVGRNFGRFFNVYVTPEIQRVGISDVQTGAPPIVLETQGSHTLQAFTFGANYNTVEDPFSPIDGETLSVAYQQAGEWAGGDWDFNKIEVAAAKYFPLWQDSLDRFYVLELKASVRRANETGDLSGVPYSERYFLGGQGSIRGFDFRGVGPRSGLFPLGGESAWYGTAELRFPLVSTRERGLVTEVEYIRGQVWVDMGSTGPSFSHIGLTRIAAGFGARIRIPFLPGMAISLDFGWPIQHEVFDDERVFSFTFGNF